jgi:hypothetical protein
MGHDRGAWALWGGSPQQGGQGEGTWTTDAGGASKAAFWQLSFHAADGTVKHLVILDHATTSGWPGNWKTVIHGDLADAGCPPFKDSKQAALAISCQNK